jgi:hypothetical protein
MAEQRRSAGRVQPGSRVRARKLNDYESRQRELTNAFVLPDDLRYWMTVRVDDDTDTQDVVTLAVTAGRTVTLLTVDVPAEVTRELRSLLAEHQEELQHRLKLDMATNLLAMMTEGPGGEE